jgi:hypothetical protein
MEDQVGASPDHRFPAPQIEANDRLVFLRAVGSDDEILARAGFDISLLRHIEESIAILLQGNIGEAEEIAIQANLEQLCPALTKPRLGGASPKVLPGRVYRPAIAASRISTPWWFTYETAVVAEERTLPNRALPLERSGYAAGVRARLGLRHASDTISDLDMAKAGSIRFRLLYQLAITVPDALKDKVRQPAMFSDGYPDLFVTNQRRHDGGRTVRLKEVGCAHNGCQCIQDGLPEGVMPQNAALDPRCIIEIRGVYLVLRRDLARFQPPSCEEIRALRSVA